MSPASTYGQITPLRQRPPSKEWPDPKQKLSRKGGEKRENIASVRAHS